MVHCWLAFPTPGHLTKASRARHTCIYAYLVGACLFIRNGKTMCRKCFKNDAYMNVLSLLFANAFNSPAVKYKVERNYPFDDKSVYFCTEIEHVLGNIFRIYGQPRWVTWSSWKLRHHTYILGLIKSHQRLQMEKHLVLCLI